MRKQPDLGEQIGEIRGSRRRAFLISLGLLPLGFCVWAILVSGRAQTNWITLVVLVVLAIIVSYFVMRQLRKRICLFEKGLTIRGHDQALCWKEVVEVRCVSFSLKMRSDVPGLSVTTSNESLALRTAGGLRVKLDHGYRKPGQHFDRILDSVHPHIRDHVEAALREKGEARFDRITLTPTLLKIQGLLHGSREISRGDVRTTEIHDGGSSLKVFTKDGEMELCGHRLRPFPNIFVLTALLTADDD